MPDEAKEKREARLFSTFGTCKTGLVCRSHSARDFLFSLPVRLKGRAAVQGSGRKAGIYGNWRVPGTWTG